MIATILMSGYDPAFRIQVQPREDGFYKVDGGQLYLAAKDHMKPYINVASVYYMERDKVKPAIYDCITLNLSAKVFYPTVNTRIVMRVQMYDEDGCPCVTVEDCDRAGLPMWRSRKYKSVITGYVHLKPTAIRFC